MTQFAVCPTCRMVTPLEGGACAYYDQQHDIDYNLDRLFC